MCYRTKKNERLFMTVAEPELENSPLLELLGGFIIELREAGLPVSLTENLDAMEAVTHIPLEDRESFKYALGATLVKNHAHWKAFEVVFEVYFSMRGEEYIIGSEAEGDLSGEDQEGDESALPGQGQPQGGGGGMQSLTPEQLAEMLFKALLNGDTAMLSALARQAVLRFAGMEPGRPVGGTYYLYRTLRNLDLDGVLEKLMEETEASRTMLKTYSSYVKGEVSDEELEKANHQLNELLKDLSLGLMTVIPFAPLTIPVIAKFAKKHNIDLLPEWFKDSLK